MDQPTTDDQQRAEIQATAEHTSWHTCACHTEALRVTWWDDDPLLYLSMWREGFYAGAMPWRQRLRFAWAALHGKPYEGQLVLHRDDIVKLSRTLAKTSTQWERLQARIREAEIDGIEQGQ